MRPVPLVLGALVAAASLGVAVVMYQRFGEADVAYGVRGFDVQSDSSVRVDFEVDKDPARSALCTVRARDATGAQAGTALVRVGPADQRRVVLSRDLVTTTRAASGEVTGCSLEPAAPGRP